MPPNRARNSTLAPALLLAALLLVLSGALVRGERAGAGGGAILDLAGCTANVLPFNDDGSTGQLALGFSVNFFGTTFSNVYVNNNGNVTFDNPLFQSQTAALADLDRPIIAPLFVDVDTQGLGSETVKYGTTMVDGHDAFCVNWVDVGYYNDHADKLNRSQLLLIDRSDVAAGDFDIMFNYDKIEWESADSVLGSVGGLGGDPTARAGYSDGTSSFEIDGSGIAGCFLDTAATSGLIHNRSGSSQDGRYVFQARSGTLPASGVPTGCLEPAPPDTPTATPTDTHTPTPTATRTPTPIAAAGDVNCDKATNSLDALFVLQRVAGFLDAFACEVGDVDGSGSVDAVDATLILQYEAGLIPGLPV